MSPGSKPTPSAAIDSCVQISYLSESEVDCVAGLKIFTKSFHDCTRTSQRQDNFYFSNSIAARRMEPALPGPGQFPKPHMPVPRQPDDDSLRDFGTASGAGDLQRVTDASVQLARAD